MQPYAKHQQDHAEFGELARQRLVGNEAGRERTNQDSSDEVADQWRQAKSVRQRAENEGESEAGDKGCDKWRLRHLPNPVSGHAWRSGQALHEPEIMDLEIMD